MSRKGPAPAWKVALVVCFYMIVAIVMVLANKWVLNDNAGLPLTFLFAQLLVGVACLYLWAAIKRTGWSTPRWHGQTISAMVPVATINVVGLVFNTYCLRVVDASYFQVARGLTLPMTILFDALMGRTCPTRTTLFACLLVTYGFTYSYLPVTLGGGGGLPEAPAFGMVLGFLSATMVGVHVILIQSALKHLEGSTLDLAYWSNALSAIMIFPGIFIGTELASYEALLTGTDGNLRTFAIGSIVTGVVGFLICLAGLLSIKITSPVTHMFASSARSVLQTILGVKLFGEVMNSSRITSITFILLGSLVYTWHRAMVRKSPAPAAPPPPPLSPTPARSVRFAEPLITEKSSVTSSTSQA